MGQLSDALEAAAGPLEARFRAHRNRMRKEGLVAILPQSWRFETESEVAVLRLAKNGRVSVGVDVIEAPAVIVRWTHQALVSVLLSGRSNEAPRDPPPTIRFTTDAGRKAFSLLGTSLGL